MKKTAQEPKVTDNPLYHDTWMLLRKYRDVVWSLELSVQQVRRQFQIEYGSTIEEFLESLYVAGITFEGSAIEDHARCIERSYKMLKLLDTSVELLRTKHKYGESYYWLLYYALLSGLYVVPISDSLLLRLISFIKLTIFGHVPFAVTRKLFRKDRRSANERRVYRLSRQALLSTAELIKCVEYDIHTIHSDSQLMDALYADDTTTSDNIADMVRPFVCCRPVLQAVANLYLRRQIIFERLS